MSRMRPFRALCPPPELASRVASVPYDVVNTEEARELAAGNEMSFLHVVRPEIDLPADVGPYDDRVYETGASNLRRFAKEGWLAERGEPGFLIYRLRRGDHVQTGVVGCCSVDEYDADLIVKHEKTRPDKEDDRTRHLLTQSAHAEPVLLASPPSTAIDRYLEAVTANEPLYDFTSDDGIGHTVWAAPETAQVEGLFAELPRIYVADGHHRTASASRARATRQEENPVHTGDEEVNFFLAVVFPSDQLQILAYNRVVKDLRGMTPAAFLEQLSGRFRVEEGAPTEPARRGEVSMYLDGRWYGLWLGREDEPAPAHAAQSLDIARLSAGVLEPMLGIGDPRTDKRIDFVGGGRGPQALVQRVDAGDAAVAFSMFPTSMEELMAVADAGEVMPPKSTWFEPKLRSGLFVHPF